MAYNDSSGAKAPDRKPRPPAGPGKLANRQDMSRVTIAGQPAQGVYSEGNLQYGDRTRIEQGLAAAPIPQGAHPAATGSHAAPSGTPTPAGGAALSFEDLLTRPSRYPDEPITAGLAIGAGPGPEALSGPTMEEPSRLRRLLASVNDPALSPDLRARGAFYAFLESVQQPVAPTIDFLPDEIIDEEDILPPFDERLFQ